MKRKPTVAAGGAPASAAPRSSAADDSAGLGARRLALEILLRVQGERAFADLLLGRRIGALPVADRRLVTQLVLGTLAWQGRLDYELAYHSAYKLKALAPELLAILRMGLFQLRILTRIPPHAAVDTAVTLARGSRIARAAGLVNAILRSAIRHPVALPAREADLAEHLAVAWSHPRWLVEMMLQWFGPAAAEALMAADNRPAPNVLRLNLARKPAEEIVAELGRDGMAIARRGRLAETVILGGAPVLDAAGWQAGLFYPQSEASQLVVRLLAPSSGAVVVDCAAAPGGKATHLAELVGPAGRVIALDLNFLGLIKVRSIARRLRHRNLALVRADARVPLPLRPASIDFVLLDAPCTGLGTLRQHPEIRWRLSRRDIERMAALQKRMLANAAALVRRGGALVYAVCSLAPQEGVEVIRGFVAENPGFEVSRCPPTAGQLQGLIDGEGFMRTRPDQHGLDGFFAARLTRRG